MNTPISFKLSKLLKEKGFNNLTLEYYFEDGIFVENEYLHYGGDYSGGDYIEYNQLVENWNQNWLMKKNGEKSFGVVKSNIYFEIFSAPKIIDVVEWIYEKYGIWISVAPSPAPSPSSFKSSSKFRFITHWNKKDLMNDDLNEDLNFDEDFNNPTEAYNSAIEYVFHKLMMKE
jgi:hypothetical protein